MYFYYRFFYLLCADFGERDGLQTADLFSSGENSITMKTPEETVDFEKEFRPDDVGECKRESRPSGRIFKKKNFVFPSVRFSCENIVKKKNEKKSKKIKLNIL